MKALAKAHGDSELISLLRRFTEEAEKAAGKTPRYPDFWEAVASCVSPVGLTDPERLPSATLYIMFALAYLGLIGFGLYVYLRTRGLGIYYHAFVPIAACAGALVVSVMAIRLKQGDPAADYSVVRELNGGSVSDEGFVRLLSSSGNDFRLKVPEEAGVIPVVREAKTAGLFAAEKPLPRQKETGNPPPLKP